MIEHPKSNTSQSTEPWRESQVKWLRDETFFALPLDGLTNLPALSKKAGATDISDDIGRGPIREEVGFGECYRLAAMHTSTEDLFHRPFR